MTVQQEVGIKVSQSMTWSRGRTDGRPMQDEDSLMQSQMLCIC